MKTNIFRLHQDEKQSIIERIADDLQLRAEIMFAYVYGSFVERLDTPIHDLDVGVYVTGMGKEASTEYAIDMAQALGKKAKLPVDVIVLNFAPPSFLYHVFRGSLLFTRNEDIRTRIVEDAVRRYLDLKFLVRRGVKEAFAA